jgi:hypothetical protein
MTHDTQADYIRSDELDEAAVPIAWLPRLFNVSESTIRRWIRADDITTFDHPTEQTRPGMPDRAIRYGDIPSKESHSTRWHRRTE